MNERRSKSRSFQKRPARPVPTHIEVPEGRVVVGMQPVREVLRCHGQATRVYLQAGLPRLDGLEKMARDRGADVRRVEANVLDQLGDGHRHQGVIAIAPELVVHTLDDILKDPPTLVVALDGIVDPQNFGAVVRSSVALGGATVLWAEHGAAPLTPTTFRASAGAIEHATLCRVRSLAQALTDLTEAGFVAVGLEAQAERRISELDLRVPTVVVVGAEDRGMKPAVRRTCTLARLPMPGPIGSLNASVACAIALYEVGRQRAST